MKYSCHTFSIMNTICTLLNTLNTVYLFVFGFHSSRFLSESGIKCNIYSVRGMINVKLIIMKTVKKQLKCEISYLDFSNSALFYCKCSLSFMKQGMAKNFYFKKLTTKTDSRLNWFNKKFCLRSSDRSLFFASWKENHCKNTLPCQCVTLT